MQTEFRKLEDIRVSDRIRKEFKEQPLADLASDIQTNGLLHAPAVDAGGNLVAGERRLRAISLIYTTGGTFRYAGSDVPEDLVPITIVDASEPDQLLEIELNENLMRQDLTWQERVAATAKLHELRTAQNPNQTFKETAREIRGPSATTHDQTKVAQASQIAKFLDDPEVRGAQTERVALRVAQKKAAQAALTLREKDAVGRPETTHHDIRQGDSFSLLETLLDASVDIVLTDPPYGVGADKFNNKNTLKHNYRDDEDYGLQCYTTLAVEAFRVCKPDAHLYTFLDIRLFDRIKHIFAEVGWTVWDRPFIWYKGSQGYWPSQDYGPRLSYETILYARKGKRRVLECANDVIDIPLKSGVERQAAKPSALYHNLLKRSALAGDTILDPFCGSGPVIPAANTLSCKVIAFDIDPEAITLTQAKVKEKVNDVNDASLSDLI